MASYHAELLGALTIGFHLPVDLLLWIDKMSNNDIQQQKLRRKKLIAEASKIRLVSLKKYIC